MHLLVKIELKKILDMQFFTHLCLYFYTHCSLVCLLHYVCDFMYICVLLVLALSRS